MRREEKKNVKRALRDLIGGEGPLEDGKIVDVYMLNIQERDEEWIFQTIDGLVSENSLYRAINRYVDWSFIYPLVKDEYSTKGRPSIDPVNIFKIHVISILEGFNSVRKTMRHIQNNIEFRWFLNLPFSKKVPDHSSLNQAIKRLKNGKAAGNDGITAEMLKCGGDVQ